jgi:thiol:disulfide interchange protein DsbD
MNQAWQAILIIAALSAPTAIGQVSYVPDPAHSGKLEIKPVLIIDNPFSSVPGNGVPTSFLPGEIVTLELRCVPARGFHTYPINSRTAIQDPVGLTKVEAGPASMRIIWPVREPSPVEINESALGGKILEFDGPFTWTIDLLVPPDAKPGHLAQQISLKAQVCDNKGCTWGTHKFTVKIEVSGNGTTPSAEVLAAASLPTSPEPMISGSIASSSKNQDERRLDKQGPVTKLPFLPDPTAIEILGVYPEATIQDPSSFSEFLEEPKMEAKADNQGLLAFVIQGVFWGAVSLVTPCVFPMIPVTVSIFLKHKSHSWINPILHASVYCSTIVVVMTLAAMAFLSAFVWLSINSIFNIMLGCVFIAFALSLFGMYDIELPGFMTRFTSNREQQGGFIGTFFMALTFSMLSFACVAPFLGGFGGTSSGDGVGFLHKFLGGIAFSATFASPFFILALFPKLLGALPRSGGWMNTVKITMGFVELAAAVKFFRLAEIRNGEAVFFTYDMSLAFTIAVFFLAGIYHLKWISFPSEDPDNRQVPVPRIVLGLVVMAVGLYFIPGLWRQNDGSRIRPQGIVFAWIDAFLLPDSGEGEDLPFTGDLSDAIVKSKQDGRPIFIDFTGVTCVNCKLNEKNVFPIPGVKSLLLRYHLVQLYTDRVIDQFVPAGTPYGEKLRLAESNAQFRDSVFGVNQLPLYAIVRPK